MEIGASQEDYLEAIYLMNQNGIQVKSVQLAKTLGKSKPSVSVAMQTLENKGYLKKAEHGILILTDKGKNLAEKIYDRHQFFYRYFVGIGLQPEEAEVNACSIEHVLSETCYRRLKEVLK